LLRIKFERENLLTTMHIGISSQLIMNVCWRRRERESGFTATQLKFNQNVLELQLAWIVDGLRYPFSGNLVEKLDGNECFMG
jgi:hypothetical protein